MQASLLTVPGGSYFSSPLSVALSSYMEEPQCQAALLDALMSLAASPDIQRLAQPAAPDQQPETALVCSHSRLQKTSAPRKSLLWREHMALPALFCFRFCELCTQRRIHEFPPEVLAGEP